MQRNECKRFVLSAVQDLKDPVPSCLVQTWLSISYNVELSDKATSMACLRLMRQGLLHRRQGKYSLSEKGEQRPSWLRSTMQ
jgi:hypothetical protein